MKKLIQGIIEFRKKRAPEEKKLFARLAKEQRPDALFIACADSRVAPNVFASTNPGDLFVIRNVGNIVPPIEACDTGMIAALEFAALTLKVADIIVCGHSGCGAIDAVKYGTACCPHMEKWVEYAAHEGGDLTQANVLKQLEHLKSYPFLKEIRLHGWWFNIEEAAVYAYDDKTKRFVLIDDLHN